MVTDHGAPSPGRTPQQITSIVYRHWIEHVREFPHMRNDLEYKMGHFAADHIHLETCK